MSQWKTDEEMLGIIKEKLYTPVIGDILSLMGLSHQILPPEIKPLVSFVSSSAYNVTERDNRLKIAGFACTVLVIDIFEPPKRPFGYLPEALDQLKRNEVFIASGAHNGVLWGNVLTTAARLRGAAGAVLDGYSRDTAQVLSQNFPVFCRNTWAQDPSIRTYVCDYRCAIEIGQVIVHDGDIVCGDVDGIVVIPGAVKDEVLERALIKAEERSKICEALEGGMPASQAFAEFSNI